MLSRTELHRSAWRLALSYTDYHAGHVRLTRMFNLVKSVAKCLDAWIALQWIILANANSFCCLCNCSYLTNFGEVMHNLFTCQIFHSLTLTMMSFFNLALIKIV